ncbi:MAG: AAA family ATPase [Candidatus Thorarchaeota archaeon]|jgi:vacuolar protein-sorting-associated protein 4
MADAGNNRVDAGLKKLLDKAVDLDRRGMRKEACHHYLTASKVLIKLSKSASLPAVRKFYFDRAQECVDRVRYLSGIKKKTGKPPDGLRVPPSRIKESESSTESKDSHIAEMEVDEERLRLHETITDTIITERPTVKMTEVAGLEEAKQAVYEAIAAPLKHPELFKGKARQPWKGILLYGPAGCGKTLIAKAVAAEVDATFFSVSAANIVSKWLGESEKLVSTLFSEARKNQPSVIFIDELDSVGVARSGEDVGGERRLKTQLLTELEGLGTSEADRVTLIGATNLPWELDFALRSRFEKKIHVPLPDKTARVEIFRIHMDEIDVVSDVDYGELADLSEGYSGRDISVVCREAAMEAIRDLQRTGRIEKDEKITDLRSVTRSDFIKAIDNIRPATSPEDVGRYMDWAEGS